ncbi:hypothetical protein V8G56_16080 [Gaetbulibacter aquiaggeris]|uniref:ATPase AAA-type core domain-containing protein n=1 Tax=Gaetbulibacter aquiaggeris TaxID=1735373 RepID=A0ABW7MTV0_9FLAO
MRLAAIYITSGVLPYVFGSDHSGYTLNLGGKYRYVFEEYGDDISLKEKISNSAFLEGFWGDNLYLVSALVGANGTGKSSILNVFRNNSFCYFIYEYPDGDEFKIVKNTEKINDIIYYTPFLNIQNQDYVNGNFKDISKYELMLEDTEYETVALSSQLELHNSENLKRWIKFRQLNGVEPFLSEISLPVFNKINIKINFVGPRVHDTSYRFRPFFDRFKAIKDEEEIRKFDQLREINPEVRGKDRPKYFGSKIKLELEIIERVIDKVQNILEVSGNKYLNEGYINNSLTVESQEFSEILGFKDAFYWFLDNAFIQFSKDSEKILFPADKIKKLIEVLLVNIPDSSFEIENWTELNVSLDVALEILNAYEEFIISFKDDFNLDRKILLTFRPDKNISSGEKNMYDLFSSLYDYQFKVDQNILEDYNRYSRREGHNDNYLILLDEADLGFHPQWRKKFVKSILELFSFLFTKKKIQILFTSHDPLSLSDIPKNNVVFLDKHPETKLTYVLNEDQKELKRTFGANITNLLADSFFVKDGLIGDFAKTKINEIINWINSNKNQNIKRNDGFSSKLEYYKNMINIIDERIIKLKLSEMISELDDNNDFNKKLIDDEIEYLRKKRMNLDK